MTLTKRRVKDPFFVADALHRVLASLWQPSRQEEM